MCVKDPLFHLIIGNVSGARKSNGQNPKWKVVAAAVTRAQAREHENPKPRKVKKMTLKLAKNKKELVRLEKEEDSTMQEFKKAKGTEIRNDTRFLMKILEEFGTICVSERMEWEILKSIFWCPSR